jgi:hypothetical protein
VIDEGANLVAVSNFPAVLLPAYLLPQRHDATRDIARAYTGRHHCSKPPRAPAALSANTSSRSYGVSWPRRRHEYPFGGGGAGDDVTPDSTLGDLMVLASLLVPR